MGVPPTKVSNKGSLTWGDESRSLCSVVGLSPAELWSLTVDYCWRVRGPLLSCAQGTGSDNGLGSHSGSAGPVAWLLSPVLIPALRSSAAAAVGFYPAAQLDRAGWPAGFAAPKLPSGYSDLLALHMLLPPIWRPPLVPQLCAQGCNPR